MHTIGLEHIWYMLVRSKGSLVQPPSSLHLLHVPAIAGVQLALQTPVTSGQPIRVPCPIGRTSLLALPSQSWKDYRAACRIKSSLKSLGISVHSAVKVQCTCEAVTAKRNCEAFRPWHRSLRHINVSHNKTDSHHVPPEHLI